MMCLKHNRWYRVGENCQFCVAEMKERIELDREISILEKEVKEPIILWEGSK